MINKITILHLINIVLELHQYEELIEMIGLKNDTCVIRKNAIWQNNLPAIEVQHEKEYTVQPKSS